LTPQRSLNPKTFNTNPAFNDLNRLAKYIREYGCDGCELGQQKTIKGPVLNRGNPTAEIMAVGEGPGKIEDRDGKVFIGPAGELGDRIFQCIDIDTNEDVYLCNVSNCRYCAPYKSGRENLTPTEEHTSACLPYFFHQLNIVKPKILITLGMTAFKSLFPERAKAARGVLLSIVGKPFLWDEYNIPVLPMYHPAVLIHSKNDKERLLFYRRKTYEQIQLLGKILDNDFSLKGVVNE